MGNLYRQTVVVEIEADSPEMASMSFTHALSYMNNLALHPPIVRASGVDDQEEIVLADVVPLQTIAEQNPQEGAHVNTSADQRAAGDGEKIDGENATIDPNRPENQAVAPGVVGGAFDPDAEKREADAALAEQAKYDDGGTQVDDSVGDDTVDNHDTNELNK